MSDRCFSDTHMAKVATVAEQMRRRAEAAEDEVGRLREALESVCNVGDRAAVLVAREALYLFNEPESDDPFGEAGKR